MLCELRLGRQEDPLSQVREEHSWQREEQVPRTGDRRDCDVWEAWRGSLSVRNCDSKEDEVKGALKAEGQTLPVRLFKGLGLPLKDTGEP